MKSNSGRTLTALEAGAKTRKCDRCGGVTLPEKLWGVNRRGITTDDSDLVAAWVCQDCFCRRTPQAGAAIAAGVETVIKKAKSIDEAIEGLKAFNAALRKFQSMEMW